MSTPVIAGAVRTPIGAFMGALAPMPATDLGALVIRESLAPVYFHKLARGRVEFPAVVRQQTSVAPTHHTSIHQLRTQVSS